MNLNLKSQINSSEELDRPMIHVVVIDDVVRFALHVWRYLDQGLGFRIGSVQDDEWVHFYTQAQTPKGRTTADGKVAVWWVPAEDSWEDKLKEVRETIGHRETETLYLVDVKSSAGGYSAQRVVTWLGEQGVPRHLIFVVSSYTNERVPGFELWPKSPATLQELATSARPKGDEEAEATPDPCRVIGDSRSLDILVTGAGFEYGDLPLGFGLPPTRDLLCGMGLPFGTTDGHSSTDSGPKIPLKTVNGGFPVPCSDEFVPPESEADGTPEISLYRQMLDLAQEEQLDEWWDLLLETKLRSHLQRQTNLEERRRAKRQARQLEVEMRMAFRNAILRHDWGHLTQSLAAARLPWCAWLTTNYTRFADRAISLTEEAKHREARLGLSVGEREPSGGFGQAPNWRVVATAQEAQLLLRELQDRAEGEMERSGPEDHQTPLFKLHGDISHLQTMAIAGHDKDVFSLLSVPVDSVYQVYNAAEKYLLHAIDTSSDEQRIRFHVVGHALKDSALVQVLARVIQAGQSKNITLKLVGPDPHDWNESRSVLQDRLDVEVLEETAKAVEYMASLRSVLRIGRRK